MVHLIVFIYVFAVAIGFSSVTIAALLTVQYRSRAVSGAVAFFGSLTLFSAELFLAHYAVAAHVTDSSFFSLAEQVLGAAGGLLFVWRAPFFFQHLLGREPGRLMQTVFHLLPGVAAAALALSYLTGARPLFLRLLNLIMLGIIAHGIASGASAWREIGDPGLKKAVRFFFIASAIFFPFLVIDTSGMNIPILTWDLSLPFYFIAIATGLSLYLYRFFNRPPFLEREHVTDYFRARYGVTQREAEIVEELLAGRSNGEIAEMLFIAVKTVENHLYNVYQKTGVKNRVQLFNLLRAHEAV